MKDIDEKNVRDTEGDSISVSETGAEIGKESNVNFIMCNEYGVDLEKTKVPLLESSEENDYDDYDTNFSLEELPGWNDEDYEDRHTITLLILGIIIAIILSYCAILTFKINKIDEALIANNIKIGSNYSDALYSDVEVDVLEEILISKVVDYGYSGDLIAAIYYIDSLSDKNMQPYDLFNKFAKAIEDSNISLTDTEYDAFAHIINHKIYEFMNNNRLSEREAEKVGVMLQKVLNNSLNRF